MKCAKLSLFVALVGLLFFGCANQSPQSNPSSPSANSHPSCPLPTARHDPMDKEPIVRLVRFGSAPAIANILNQVIDFYRSAPDARFLAGPAKVIGDDHSNILFILLADTNDIMKIDKLIALLDVEVVKEQKETAANHTSEGIRQSADGPSKPTM